MATMTLAYSDTLTLSKPCHYRRAHLYFAMEKETKNVILFEVEARHLTCRNKNFQGLAFYGPIFPFLAYPVTKCQTCSVKFCNCHFLLCCVKDSLKSSYSEARLLVPCLIVQPSLLFIIGREWNGLSFHVVKLLG